MSSRSTASKKQEAKPKSEPSSISAEDMAKLRIAYQKALQGLVVLTKMRGDTLH